MSAIVINDLPTDHTLDRAAMAVIHGGGGAPWVFGWITPYVPPVPVNASFGQAVNLYQVTNNYYADQMNNQFQSISVSNTGANSNISLDTNQITGNIKH